MADSVTLVTGGEAETVALGLGLARVLRGGERIGLSGELGAGKTCLVRGLAEGLGIPPDRVCSPSFTTMVAHEGGRLPLYHIDLFRLRPTALDRMELREYLYGGGVAAVEWFELLGEPLEDCLEISLTFVGPNTRTVVAVGHGLGYARMLQVVRDLAKAR